MSGVLLRLTFLVVGALGEGDGYWDASSNVGPSKNFAELDSDNFAKKVFRDDKDVLVTFYGDQCKLCKDLKPKQEKTADKIKKLTDKIAFTRIDDYRMGNGRTWEGHAIAFSKGGTAPKGFEEGEIPKMFFIKAGTKEPMLVPHHLMGWGKDGHKKLFKYIREMSTFPEELSTKKNKPEKEEM
eukprot:TRINITY_DN29445_c0_g1_i2.p2 TRINITY_DN29445_c0_g1~~TRINITY_DN29445_c0_g1_i2.p2  ORF type:complete len:183 (+),score=67.69 TRINITY_DN29445_c0_g1_i2:73-621(+)